MKGRWLIIALFGTLSAQAQFLTDPDQNPTRLRWSQLRSPHFRLIYPRDVDSTARQTLTRLEQIYEPVSQSLGRRPRPIPIVLQNQTTISNGFVTLLPRRSEFFTTAPQDPFLSGTLNWLDQLAIHEFRHVVQYEKGLTGISLVAYRLFGYGALAGLSLGLPDWFFEGDAVGTETALSRGGRGRIPEFDLGFRANLLAGRRFSYPKAVGGSFRDNVPNHYILGYFLTTYLRRNYNADAWSRILTRYYRFPLYPFSFSASLRRTTGLRVETLYQKTLADLDEQWRRQTAELRLTEAEPFPIGRNRSFTNYRFPQAIAPDAVVAVRSGLEDIEQLVLLQKGKAERRLHWMGLFNNPEMLSASAGKVAWLEFIPDPRWGLRIFSDIKLLDVETGRVTRLSHRARYGAVALSPDARRLVAVQNDESGRTRLVVLDAGDGRELQTFPDSAGVFHQQPRWSDDSRSVVFVRQTSRGKALAEWNAETGAMRLLTTERIENISHPQPWKEWVLYNSPVSGIDNIYALNRQTGERFQVTSRKLGAYHAAVSGNRLVVQDFTPDGHRIVDMPLNPSAWTPVGRVPDGAVRYFGPLLNQESGPVLLDTVAASRIPARPYSRLANALNIYSWGPLLASDGQGLSLGIQSQDLLGTTLLAGGYRYDANERTNGYFASLSYRALYPFIDVGVSGGQRRTSSYIDRALPLDSLRRDLWNYTQWNAGLRLPLNLTRSRYRQGLTLSANYGFLTVRDYNLPRSSFGEITNGTLHTLNYGLNYSALLKQSKRDVAPRKGIAVSAIFRHTPFGGQFQGQLGAVAGSLYVPGIGKHHTLRLRGGYQQQWGRTDTRSLYRFAPGILYPRGADYIAYDQLQIAGAEYHLPLLNPHWALGRWLYIQRIRGVVFTDYAEGSARIPTQNGGFRTVRGYEHTVGADLVFAFNPLRLRIPLEVGVRATYNVRTGEFRYEPLIIDIGF